MLDLGRQVPAGLAFAASSLKITTSLPFLLLPFERRSWRVLMVFGLGVIALCLCLYSPSRLPGMAKSHLANVSAGACRGRDQRLFVPGPLSRRHARPGALALLPWDARQPDDLRLAAWDSGRPWPGAVLGLPAPISAPRRAAAGGLALRLLVHLPLSPQLRFRHPGTAAAVLRGSGKRVRAGRGRSCTRPWPPG